jgi:hypothetical protein
VLFCSSSFCVLCPQFCRVSGLPILDCSISGFSKVYLISAYSQVYWTQLYVIKIVNDLWQVCGFLQFLPPFKLRAILKWKWTLGKPKLQSGIDNVER